MKINTLQELWIAIKDAECELPFPYDSITVLIKGTTSLEDVVLKVIAYHDYLNISRSLFDKLIVLAEDINILEEIEKGNARLSSIKREINVLVPITAIEGAARIEKLTKLGI